MADKPTRFYVAYEDDKRYAKELARVGGVADAVEPANYEDERDAGNTLTAARRLARTLAKEHSSTVWIYERAGLHAEHPEEDYPGFTSWEWETRQLEEYTPGRGFTVFAEPEK